jgi:hypothetical protein
VNLQGRLAALNYPYFRIKGQPEMPENDKRRTRKPESGKRESGKREKRSWPWRLVSFIAGALLGALISVGLSKGLTGGEVQPFEAQGFLGNYFGSAVRPTSIEQAWQMLTSDFRQNLQGGYGGYLTWYKKWYAVNLGEVQPLGNNLFRVNVTYVGTGNQPQLTGTGVFSLSCADFIESYDPFNASCSVKNIRMSYYGFSSIPD